jgi:energy-coupling factor transporter ATP-binding protein EcfA2
VGLSPGTELSLLGPDGSGKSTLSRVLAGAVVLAALGVIDQARKKYLAHWSPGRPPEGLPELTADRWRHRLGKAGPVVLPPLLLVVWLAVLASALMGKH